MITYSARALKGLLQIDRWIAVEQENESKAEAVVEAIRGKIQLLETYPQLGPAGRQQGTRELLIDELYIVVYRIKTRSHISIEAIFDGRAKR